MTAPLGIGLIGCGRAAERLHCPAAIRVGEARLVAVADPARERANLIAGRLTGCRVFDSAEELLEEGNVAAVVIANPPEQHVTTALMALRRGVSVLVEKPLATSSHELAGLEQLALSSPVALMMGFNRRYWEPVQRLRAQLSEQADCVSSVRLLFTTDPRSWAAICSSSDPLENLGSHQLDLVSFLFDRDIKSIGARWVDRTAIEMRVTLSGGLVAEARAAHVKAYEEWLEVETADRCYRVWSGSNRVAPARGPTRMCLDVTDALRRRLLGRVSSLRLSYDRQLSAFVEYVRDGGTPVPGLKEGTAAVRAIEAARRSAEADGREVKV